MYKFKGIIFIQMKCSIRFYLSVFFSAIVFSLAAQQLHVPLGGNAWVHSAGKNDSTIITDSGLINWQHKETVISVYVYFNKKGAVSISPDLIVPGGGSSISIAVDGKKHEFSMAGQINDYRFSSWKINHTGYTRIDLQGISRTGNEFARVKELLIEGDAVDDSTAFVKNNEDNYFYWGRRGPSVHLNYQLPDTANNIEWFYNEVTVPKSNDVIGSFFMANGFGEGYFGMQVNSPTERRILFSVWSPFETDDPAAIPADKKIIMVKKGKDVYTGEFGNEGSGGQSFLQYNWKAGNTYKFLLSAKPVENNYTNYTAYFYATDLKKWMLIASFNRPATHTYLTRLHSFLENFEPVTGNITRKAFYHNQWIRTNIGKWMALSNAVFTADATARKGFRLDFSGGVVNNQFYLRNAGFFNNRTAIQSRFTVKAPAKIPVIDWKKLNALIK